jgi:2-polyprenyl-3-methyl-5-hydroxy-6-metoxy-1,4-benzoquinol methylase
MLSNKEFFEVEHKEGQTQDNPDYLRLHYTLAEIMKNRLDCKSVFEIGPGPGALMEGLSKLGIYVEGIDQNQYSKEYFVGRNQHLADKYHWLKLSGAAEVVKATNFDTVVSIETMEHIKNSDMEKIIFLLSQRCRWFWFSSTPKKTDWDESWGHINIKYDHQWVWWFEKLGWKFVEWTKMPTEWSMLFETMNIK